MDKVCAWTEKILIPTYKVGKPEKNPLFLEKRVYQGSSGAVYPHAVIENIAQQKTDEAYDAVFIENKYLRIMILPALGGKIYRAYDKIRQRDFVYYNQVIKPALVGLTGPWVSGGIEFNWPQHHRPSTFEPVDYSITENEDGGKTVWVNEVELMTRTKGMAGFTLSPDRAYLEVKGKIFNRTPFPQTFLWWANPAVKVNEQYQSVFPPDVHAVFDHGKRDVSSFPIATGTYYKVDYSPGTDISRYSNIPVPTSFMAVESEYDFLGGYEHDAQAGMLHVANHHFSPGKKQWTWGNGSFGRAWDNNLTDEDGPYIELMCGVYTDNQPDFSWLQPNEEKSFEQYFFPYAQIGVVKNATKEAAVNLTVTDTSVSIQVYATSTYADARIRLSGSGITFYEKSIALYPERPFHETVNSIAIQDKQIVLEVFDNAGKLLVHYAVSGTTLKATPSAASPMKDPADITTTELLFLNGLHLEQYRHATFHPTDYYLEAIRREPADIRNNNAMGLWLLRHGQPEAAERYLRTAIESATSRNPNPYDGEAFYNLGMCLQMQQKYDEAFAAFYKSAWNDAWQHSAYLQMARIATRKKDFAQALYLVDKSLIKSYHSHSARHLKVVILRKLNKLPEAERLRIESLVLDPFNYGCLFEQYLINGVVPALGVFNHYAEYALDYACSGMFDEASGLLELYHKSEKNLHPLFYYYLGWFKSQGGDDEAGALFLKKGASADPDYCFPSKYEEVLMLKSAIASNPEDFQALYYLGNYWFANRNYQEAIDCWEASVVVSDRFPTPLRNLALAYYNKLNDKTLAIQTMEKAFHLDRTDARVLMELDQLYKQLNYPAARRLRLLEENLERVKERNDLYLERITLYNITGQYETAAALMNARTFQPWEGGEGKVVTQFIISHVERARQLIGDGDPQSALEIMEATDHYPDNLGEGKLPGARDNDVNFWKGVALEKMGLVLEAAEKFRMATFGNSVPEQAIFYNDAQPDKIFYQGKAWQKLGETEKADEIFKRLIEYGEVHLNDKIKIDYFAVSLPDMLVFDQDLDVKNKVHCHYVMGLGYLGLGNKSLSTRHFSEVLQLNVNHQGAGLHLNRPDL